VRVLEGRVIGGDSGEPDAVRACQCRLISDVRFEVEDVPPILITPGRVSALKRVAPDVVELTVELVRGATYLPGQYYQLQFHRFPMRCYSPTVPFDDATDERKVRFHIRIVPDGRVSTALGREIRVGHRVKLNGPFGSAYMRPNLDNRLVLISSGTGFAPIWAIADAAMQENPDREMVVIAGARTLASLYMVPGLLQLAGRPNVTVIPVTSEPQSQTRAVRTGRPTDHLPELSPDDLIYTCGAPPMVEAVAKIAAAAGAVCYADAFVPKPDDDTPLLARALGWLTGEVRGNSAPTVPSEPAPKRSWRAAAAAATSVPATLSGAAPLAIRPRDKHPDDRRVALPPPRNVGLDTQGRTAPAALRDMRTDDERSAASLRLRDSHPDDERHATPTLQAREMHADEGRPVEPARIRDMRLEVNGARRQHGRPHMPTRQTPLRAERLGVNRPVAGRRPLWYRPAL